MKRRRRPRGTVFYCFSPPIMLATCIIEAALLLYVLYRYKPNLIVRLIVVALFCLALFQMAEYNVCGQFVSGADGWSRAGFAAITLLPALGLHMMQVISGRGWSWLKWVGYGGAAAWMGTFTLAEQAFDPHVCNGNYVIFHLSGDVGGLYFIHYYIVLFITLALAAYFAKTAAKSVRKTLHLFILGYSVFIVPTLLVNSLDPDTVIATTSIMCGFAVIYALILVFAILPRLKVPKRRD